MCIRIYVLQANPNVGNENGWHCIVEAQNQSKIYELLLKHGADHSPDMIETMHKYNYQIAEKLWQEIHNTHEVDTKEEKAIAIGVNECINLINSTIKNNSKYLNWNSILNEYTFDSRDDGPLKKGKGYLLQHAVIAKGEETLTCQLVELMLSLGADPNIHVTDEKEAKNEHLQNALFLAARAKKSTVVKLLLYRGNANINFQHCRTRGTVCFLLFCFLFCFVLFLFFLFSFWFWF